MLSLVFGLTLVLDSKFVYSFVEKFLITSSLIWAAFEAISFFKSSSFEDKLDDSVAVWVAVLSWAKTGTMNNEQLTINNETTIALMIRIIFSPQSNKLPFLQFYSRPWNLKL